MQLSELSLDRNLYRVTSTSEDESLKTSSSSSSSSSNSSSSSSVDSSVGTTTPTPNVQSGSAANDVNVSTQNISCDKISSGKIYSKQITLTTIPGLGDVYIAAGKTDFTNTDNGFILGVDDSDQLGKFYIGGLTSYLNWTGTQLIIAGNITATSGNIGGFTIDAIDGIYSGSNSTRIQLKTSVGIWLGSNESSTAPFFVSMDGNLYARSGVIGGFTITATELYGGIIKTNLNVGAGYNGVIMDTAGLRGYNSLLGKVFDLPTDGNPPSFSSGIINSTIFNVNTNAIIRTSSTVGDGSANSAGILINNTGLYGCAPNQTLANANVKVLVDGTAVFNASVRGGQTDYATGIGYFLGLSGGDYKFSIGSDNNYMRWDGQYLKLKGSFDVGTNGIINNAVYTVANLPIAPTSVGFNNPSGIE